MLLRKNIWTGPRLFLLATLLLYFTAPVFGQTEDPPPAGDAPALPTGETIRAFEPEDITRRIQDLKKQRNTFPTSPEAASAQQQGVAVEAVQARRATLKTLLSAYEKLLLVTEKKAALAKEDEGLRLKLAAKPERHVGRKPPFTLNFYDNLLDRLEVAVQKKEDLQRTINMAATARNAAEQRAAQTDRQLQELQTEAANQAPDPNRQWALATATVAAEAAVVMLQAEKIIQANLDQRVALQDMTLNLLKAQTGWVYDRLEFNEKSLSMQLERLDARQADLERTRRTLLAEQKQVETRWLEAQKALGDNVYRERAPLLEAGLQARESWLNTYHIVIDQLQKRIRLIESLKVLWRNRCELVKGNAVEREQLVKWHEAVTDDLKRLDEQLKLEQRYQVTLQTQIAALEKQLADRSLAEAVKQQVTIRLKSNKRRVERRNEYIGEILGALQLTQRFDRELALRLGQAGWGTRVWAFMAKSRAWGALIIFMGSLLAALLVRLLINRVLLRLAARSRFHLDDVFFKIVHRPAEWSIILVGITLALRWSYSDMKGTAVWVAVVKTLLVLIWSVAALRFLGRIGQDAVKHWRQAGRQGTEIIRMGETAARLILIAGAIFLFLSIWDINITPLLASAGIAGVAVALAAQETLANLFGGISVMLDQPFKIGDYVILDSGERGEVTAIGMRSTRIMTRDEVMISIPNSVITNAKIINESAPKPRFRVRVRIGVAYGSDIDQVEAILLDVAQKSRRVVKAPHPRVRLRTFGDSSLDFELLCWGFTPEQKGILIHELNCAIYKEFNKAGIVIPFPQRDVYLHRMPAGPNTGDTNSNEQP